MKKTIIVNNLGCSVGEFSCQDLLKRLSSFDANLLVNAGQSLQKKVRISKQSREMDNCGVIIIISCAITAFIEAATSAYIKKISSINPDVKIILTGCLVNKRNIYEDNKKVFLEKTSQGVVARLNSLGFAKKIKKPDFHKVSLNSILIQDGCNKACSYCIVPSVRGSLQCLPAKKIIKQIYALDHSGADSVALCGPCVGNWRDRSMNMKFSSLLKFILDKTKLCIAPLQLHPHYVNNDISALFSSLRIAERVSIPIQSGSDRILKLMKRGYDSAYVTRKIMDFKKIFPAAIITTDIIIGFPQETKKDVLNTVKLLLKLPISEVDVLKYSIRPNTEAAKMPQIPENEKNRRMDYVVHILEKNNIKIHER